MKNLILLLFLCTSFIVNAQQILPGKTSIGYKSKHFIFRDANNKDVDQKIFFELAKNPVYTVLVQYLNDSTLISSLDTVSVYKKLNTKFNFSDFKDINNNIIRVQGNRTLVVNFWNTACKPCIEEIDSLNLLVQENPDITFIAFTSDSISKVKPVTARKNFLYTIIPESSQVVEFYNIETFPTHFFINKHGIIKKIVIGKYNSEFLSYLKDLQKD
jgi:AhpC/TSA family.